MSWMFWFGSSFGETQIQPDLKKTKRQGDTSSYLLATPPARTSLSGTCGPAPTYHWPGYPQCPGKEGSVSVREIEKYIWTSWNKQNQKHLDFTEEHRHSTDLLPKNCHTLRFWYRDITHRDNEWKKSEIFKDSPLWARVLFDSASIPDCSQTHLQETEREKRHCCQSFLLIVEHIGLTL